MATNLDTILGSENNIQDDLFELSKTYFPDVLPDTLKTGLFGYINEISAHSSKQNIYHTNVIYNEYFFNTASFPATIYNKAVDYDLIFSNSKPAKGSIEIAFKISELDQFKVGNVYTLRRNKTKILLGEFSFLLPYDVSINIHYMQNDPIPKALVEYDIINCHRINEDIELLYKNNSKIAYNISSIDNEYYLYMILDIFQLTVEENRQNINIARLDDQIYFDVNYSDQLVDFYTEYYYPRNSTTPIVLDKFVSDYNIGLSETYNFFNYLDESSYRIYFTKTGFTPKSNSELITYTYSSKGSLGNFRYSGGIGVELENNLTYVISIYNNLYPSGGFDRSSLLDMKKELFRSIKKVNTLNSDNDLEEYFNYLCESTFNTNSVMKFIKLQDDIMRREYGVYLALFDDNNIPFSSNSVNIVFNNITDFTNGINNTIGLNDIIVYDNATSRYRLLNSLENYLDFKYRYTSPFLIKVKQYPNGSYRLKFYNTYLDSIYSLYLKEKTTLTTNYYITNSLNIYRDPIYDNKVTFTCTIDTNITIGVSDVVSRLNRIKLVVVLRDFITNDILGYFNMNYNELVSNTSRKNTYVGILNGFNDIFIDDKYNLSNILYSHETGLLHTVNLPEDLILELIIIDNEPSIQAPVLIPPVLDNKGKLPSVEIVSSEATVREQSLRDLIFNTDDLFIASYILDTKQTKILFQSLNHMINSNIYRKDEKYIFDRIPVLSLETYRLNSRKTLFTKQMINYSSKIYDNIKNLCNNTSINLKFFNTYGVSKLYISSDNTSTTNNAVDISLSFIIRLNVQYSEMLEKKIKDFILKYVRENNSVYNNELIKSNLVTALENEFIEIKSAILNKINNSTNILSIKPKYNSDTINTRYVDIVPEYLYIGYDRNSNGTINTPKIEIIYK